MLRMLTELFRFRSVDDGIDKMILILLMASVALWVIVDILLQF